MYLRNHRKLLRLASNQALYSKPFQIFYQSTLKSKIFKNIYKEIDLAFVLAFVSKISHPTPFHRVLHF